MDLPILNLAKKSPAIIWAEPKLLYYYAALTFAGSVLLQPDQDNQINMYLFYAISICWVLFMPMAFGRYAEIILNDRSASLVKTFDRFYANYFIVIILLGAPSLMISIVDAETEIQIHNSVEYLVDFFISILQFYAIPLTFIKNMRIQAIKTGYRLIIDNIGYNVPIIFIYSFVFIINILPENYSSILQFGNLLTNPFNKFIFSMFSIIIVSMFFITGCLVVEEKMKKV